MQYIAAARLFQLDSVGSAFAGRAGNCGFSLPLGRNEPGFAGGFQPKGIVWKLSIDLYLGILHQTVVAAGLEELLLHRNSPGWVDPKQDARDVVA